MSLCMCIPFKVCKLGINHTMKLVVLLLVFHLIISTPGKLNSEQDLHLYWSLLWLLMFSVNHGYLQLNCCQYKHYQQQQGNSSLWSRLDTGQLRRRRGDEGWHPSSCACCASAVLRLLPLPVPLCLAALASIASCLISLMGFVLLYPKLVTVPRVLPNASSSSSIFFFHLKDASQ